MVDTSWQVCRDWAIPSETHPLKSDDNVTLTGTFCVWLARDLEATQCPLFLCPAKAWQGFLGFIMAKVSVGGVTTSQIALMRRCGLYSGWLPQSHEKLRAKDQGKGLSSGFQPS